ncbi:MAG: dethiobiotin synthase [Gammaproteobacteria bacterium]|nr:MAG: dethiobiotin synthase [Gammaproteobacteria bacterium]
MAKRFFVTGTNTGVGKTLVTSALLCAARQRGLRTIGLKPVAAGCEQTEEGLRNEDALALLAQTTEPLSYAQINPVALAPAIAPHIAAAKDNRRLSVDRLAGFCRGSMMLPSDLVLVEGAGGWRVPVNERETFADFVKILQLPVVLVVGMELGCINHALLTAEAIRNDGLVLAGWVANSVLPEMDCFEDNLQYLEQRLGCPLVGNLPFMAEVSADQAATYMALDQLLAAVN